MEFLIIGGIGAILAAVSLGLLTREQRRSTRRVKLLARLYRAETVGGRCEIAGFGVFRKFRSAAVSRPSPQAASPARSSMVSLAALQEDVERCANCGNDRFTEIVIKDALRLKKENIPAGWLHERSYADRGVGKVIYKCSKCGENL